MFKPKLTPIAAAILATGLLAGLPYQQAAANQQAGTNGIQEQVTYAPGRTISPQQQSAISSAAAKALRHIAAARADIHQKEPDSAKDQLGKSEKLLDIIQAALPTTKIKDRIWVAKKHLEYEDTQEVLPDLIPIYDSLDELVDYMPVKEARQHLEMAKKQLKAGKKKSATEELDATDAALVYVEADLPLAATRHLVATAKSDLAKGKLENADKALKTAEDNVVFLSVDVNEPLVTAKSSLWRATRQYAKGAYGDAKKELTKSIGYLKQAAKSGDQTVQTEASALLKKAEALEGKIDKGGDVTGNELNEVWRRTEALADRAVEYLDTGWSRIHPMDTLKSDLIEAKLHLAFAKIDQTITRDNRAADKELTKTANYLEKATQQADKYFTDAITKKQITDVSDGVSKLAKERATQRTETQYSQLTTQLRNVIQTF